MPYKIAIVEDDPDQSRNYCTAIAAKGYQVESYPSRQAALTGIKRQMPDLVVLDIILGGEIDGGFQLCRELLTENPELPVLFLTERIDEIDRISGLRLGAWDYQPKPISLNYLAERVASLLRLKEARSTPTPPAKIKRVGELSLQEDAMQAEWRGQRVDLTVTEFRLLAHLARTPGQAVAYESLMGATIQQYVTSNTINTHMRNIRRKLKALDDAFDCIRNEYGFGYRWVSKCGG